MKTSRPKQLDLFVEKPDENFFGPDLRELQAREALGLSNDWEMYRWKDLYDQAIEVGLSIPTRFERGPRKGQKKWDRKNERVFVCSYESLDAWREAWSIRTGNCLKCRGSGRQWRGWSQKEGTKYRQCPVCDGTGKRVEEDGCNG